MEPLSDPTKRSKRRCMNAYTSSQNVFFSGGIQALVKRWKKNALKTMEIMLKNNTVVTHVHAINNL